MKRLILCLLALMFALCAPASAAKNPTMRASELNRAVLKGIIDEEDAEPSRTATPRECMALLGDAIAAANGPGARRRSDARKAAKAAAAAAVAARPYHSGETLRTMRHATRRNPAGIALSATHSGRNGTTSCRSAHPARAS